MTYPIDQPPERQEPIPAPAPAAPPVPPAPIPPASEADWPVQATDTIVSLVDRVRDSTTGRVLTAARAIVFGLVAAVLGTMVAVLAIVFAVHLVTELLLLTGWDWVGVWVTYLLFGVVFCVAGALLFRRRQPAEYR
jgi:hypothetical protein